MAEYIEKEKALKALSAGQGCGTICYRAIDRIPATEVEPVRHGRWKYYRKQGIAVCTECSFERNLDENFGRAMACPNCGARMDLGGTENA